MDFSSIMSFIHFSYASPSPSFFDFFWINQVVLLLLLIPFLISNDWRLYYFYGNYPWIFVRISDFLKSLKLMSLDPSSEQ